MKQYLNVNTIKKAISPYAFYYHHLSGGHKNSTKEWQLAGLCPFHADRKAGSFYVSLTTGGFKCFSCGAKGGDIVDFTMRLYDLSFVEALRKLAADWGVQS